MPVRRFRCCDTAKHWLTPLCIIRVHLAFVTWSTFAVRVQFPTGMRGVSLFHEVKSRSWGYSVSHLMGLGLFRRWWDDEVMNLTPPLSSCTEVNKYSASFHGEVPSEARRRFYWNLPVVFCCIRLRAWRVCVVSETGVLGKGRWLSGTEENAPDYYSMSLMGRKRPHITRRRGSQPLACFNFSRNTV